MTKKLYVAGYDLNSAKRVAFLLRGAGHTITSKWLDEEFRRTRTYTSDERRQLAQMDIDDVRASDALVLLAAPYRVPGGKFVEVGAALALGKPVYVLGHRENLLMWHGLVTTYDSVESMLDVWKAAEELTEGNE